MGKPIFPLARHGNHPRRPSGRPSAAAAHSSFVPTREKRRLFNKRQGMSGRHYLVDVHCHLDDPQFDADRREVIRRAWEVGVGMVSVGTNAASSRRAVALAEEHESVWACVGVHPEEIAEHQEGGESGESAMEHIAALAERSSVVAVGECGFDYARVPREEPRQKQLPLFEAHIALVVGAQLAGFLGIVLAVPVAAALQEGLAELRRLRSAGLAQQQRAAA